jgi:hypothetical protein
MVHVQLFVSVVPANRSKRTSFFFAEVVPHRVGFVSNGLEHEYFAPVYDSLRKASQNQARVSPATQSCMAK